MRGGRRMRMRYLRPNKGTTLPQEVCYLGVAGHRQKSPEDKKHEVVYFNNFVARFARIIGDEATRNTEVHSYDTRTFWTYLDSRCSRSRPVMVFGYDIIHSLTLLGLWDQLDKGIYHRGTIIDSDPPVIVNIHSIVGRVCFIDVRNYFDMPIDDIGRSFGVKHIEIELDRITEDYKYVEATWRQKVAEVAISALMSFVREHDCGRWKSTIGMQALQAFRHRFAPRTTSVRFGGVHNGSLSPETI